MIELVQTVGPELGIVAACAALGLARATYYRKLEPPMLGPAPKRLSPRALTADEKKAVLAVLHEDRFIDLAPSEVYATLLDEGVFLCSERSMYRVLAENQEVRERRAQLRHPKYAAPELLATGPNQLWSWDITKLHGPTKWRYFYLYVILDVFSRYVVGWMVAPRESKALAERFIRETCERQGILPGQLTVHADRGSSMKSKPVARRPRGHQEPLAPARLQRQPFLGGELQDAQVPARLPREVRLHRGQPRPLQRLLRRLVQPRAPPLGCWALHAPRCPLRPGGSATRSSGDRARGRPPRPPRALRQRCPGAAGRAHRGLDQQTSKAGGTYRKRCSLNSA